MDKPKIRIDTDGNRTEIYIDEELIDKTTMIDFHLHAEPGRSEVAYDRYKLNESGDYVYSGATPVIDHHTISIVGGEVIDNVE